MRVRSNTINIYNLIRLSETVSLDQMISNDESSDGGLSDYLAAPEPPEDVNTISESEIFQKLAPGEERVVLVLRINGYSYKTIGEIMDLSESYIKHVVIDARKKLTQYVQLRSS